ncbi:sensor histidine kinase [Calothrix sp. PCC 7507]|uniref:sensor histidine kinase n=1 Tax=Calothrix sp. PCC 7507 TaxID=99598 RepID=UPI0002D4549C|nr:sensor histidine kinase [Calothrix sp. PCC 7507]
MVAEHHIDLSIAREQMRQHILQIEDLAALQERQRIARDIHDSLGNALTTLNIQLQTAHRLWYLDPALAEKFLEQAQQLGAIAIQEVRQSVNSMREVAPTEQSLTDMIDSLVQNFYQATGVLPSTNINLCQSLPTEVATTLYRIIQEALTNICKYASAKNVEIDLCHTSSIVRLLILDNGKGFSLSEKTIGFGLQGMQERVEALKGNFSLDTEPGLGCQITVYLPLSQQTVRGKTLKIVDRIGVKKTSTKDCHLKLVEPISEPETSRNNFSPNFISPISEPEILVRDFNLKLIAPTSETKTPQEDFNCKIFEPIPFQKTDYEITLNEFQPQLLVSQEDYNKLENILIEIVGPIAPTLLKKVAVHACDCQELVDNLKLHLTDKQGLELEKKTIFMLEESTPKTEINSDDLPIDDRFIIQCEQKLADFIGPIAHYLVQKAVNSSLQIYRTELVTTLATEISDPHKASQFQEQLLSEISH